MASGEAGGGTRGRNRARALQPRGSSSHGHREAGPGPSSGRRTGAGHASSKQLSEVLLSAAHIPTCAFSGIFFPQQSPKSVKEKIRKPWGLGRLQVPCHKILRCRLCLGSVQRSFLSRAGRLQDQLAPARECVWPQEGQRRDRLASKDLGCVREGPSLPDAAGGGVTELPWVQGWGGR